MSNDITLDVVLCHLPPQESQKYLFGRLDLETLKAARCVNKLWNRLVDPVLEFHVELSDDTKNYAKCFGNNRQVSSLTTTMFKGKYPPQGLALNVNMIRFTVDDKDVTVYRWASNQRRTIGLTEYNFRRLINDFYYVEKLHIQSMAVRTFVNQNLLKRVYLPNLGEVIITFFDSGFHELMPFLQNYFPLLKRASIANVSELRKDRPSAYSRIFEFISKHHQSLKDATLIFPEGQMASSVTQPMIHRDLRRDHRMPHKKYKDVKTKLEGMKLEKILWDVSMMEGTRRYDLGLTLLKGQTTLKELLLDNLSMKDIAIWSSIGSILEKSSKTLSRVTIGGCMCFPQTLMGGSSHFSCAWLQNCEQLEYLVMTICGMFVDSIELLPKKILHLNLGNMLLPNQIECISQNILSLETWILPQQGWKTNMLVPRISRYLFEVILYLPKLSKVTLCMESADIDEISEFAITQSGINQVKCACINFPKNGSVSFCIDRRSFQRNQSELHSFIEEHHRELIEDLDVDDEEYVELFLRRVILENYLLPMER